jgi:hypothetical protein
MVEGMRVLWVDPSGCVGYNMLVMSWAIDTMVGMSILRVDSSSCVGYNMLIMS